MINILAAVTNFLTPVADASTDPLSIINTHKSGDYDEVKSISVITDTAIILRRFIIGAGVVMFIVCLITILLIRNNERMYEETKSRIIRILVIVWLAESAVTIFTLILHLTGRVF